MGKMANLCGPEAEKHVEIHEEISKDGKTCEKNFFFHMSKPKGVLCVLSRLSFSFRELRVSIFLNMPKARDSCESGPSREAELTHTKPSEWKSDQRERERGLTWDETNGKVVESHCSRYHTHHSHYTVALPYQLAIATGTANLEGRC